MGIRRRFFGGVTAVTAFMLLAISLGVALPGAGAATAVKVTKYSNKLTSNTNGWCTDTAPSANPLSGCDGKTGDSGTIDIVKSSFSNGGGYAAAVAAPAGSGKHYARATGAPQATNPFYPLPAGITEGPNGCSFPADEACQGPFLLYGKGADAGLENTFPADGFTSSLKIYLDAAWATANPGQDVDWDVSLNASNGNFTQDFIFNMCSTTDNGGGWYIASSNNAGGCVYNLTPNVIEESTSGWYTFTHVFYWTPGALNVQFTVKNAGGGTVYSNLETETSVPGIGALTSPTQLGGPNYGWLPDEDVYGLPLAQITMAKNAVQP